MKHTAQSVFLAGLVLIMLLGCRTGSILDIRDAGIPAAVGQNLTMDDVAKGILAAGAKHGWTMAIQTQGHIVGTLVLSPAGARIAQEGRHPFLHRGGAQHMGIAEACHARAFGIGADARLQRDGAQLVAASPGRSLTHFRLLSLNSFNRRYR